MPSKFDFGSSKTIEILYDAVGQKLRKTVKDGTTILLTQDYLGGIEIKNNRLEAIYNEEGRAYNTNSDPFQWRYEYNLKDHLGNTRVSFSDLNGNGIIDNQTEVLSETHYYPFGLQFDGAWYDNNTNKNRYLYNGKEWNSEFGLNLNHQDWRWYDPAIGRWWVVDPKAEEADQEPLSPYHFSYNNPITHSDPDGQNPILGTMLLGAVIQGGMELGGQLLANGGDFNKVDWVDVGVEAGKGALKGSGAGLFAMGVAEVGGVAVKAGFDYTNEKKHENIINGQKTPLAVGIDATADILSTGGAKYGLQQLEKNVIKSSIKSTVLKEAAYSAKKYAANAAQNGTKVQANSAANAAKSYASKAANAGAKSNVLKATQTAVRTKSAQVAKNATTNQATTKIKNNIGA